MATIYQVAKEYRREVLALDQRALGRLTRAFAIAWESIQRQLLQLLSEAAAAEALGEAIDASWFLRRDRLEALLRQSTFAIEQFSRTADLTILNGQTEAVRLALGHAERLVSVGLSGSSQPVIAGTWNRVPDEALRNLVGFLGDGSPLARVIGEFAPAAEEAVKEGLLEGLALGRNPRETARRLSQAITDRGGLPPGGPEEVADNMARIQRRAITISRQETLRAYRGASLQSYEANSDVVTGYRRLAALDLRTCPICWALHGTFYKDFEQFASHIQCRCTMVPVLKDDMGIPQPKWETGEERFARLDEEDQRKVLGAAKFEAYRDGEIILADLVGKRTDPKWGKELREVPVNKARANALRNRPDDPPANHMLLRYRTGMPGVRGVNDSFAVRLPSGAQWFVKRMTDSYTGAEGEMLTYAIGKEVGISDWMPRPTRRVIDGQEAIVARFVPHRTFSATHGTSVVADLPRDDREIMLLFDFLIGNADRHTENAGLTPDGRIFLYDHERTFYPSTFMHEPRALLYFDLQDDGSPMAFRLSRHLIGRLLGASKRILKLVEESRLDDEHKESLRARLGILREIAKMDDPRLADLVRAADDARIS